MIGEKNRTTILNRIRTDQPYSTYLRDAASSVLDVGERMDVAKGKIEADQALSDMGRRMRLAESVQKSIAREYAVASKPVRKGIAHLKAKRDGLKLPELDRTDSVGELRRQEVRSYLRSLPEPTRIKRAFELANDPKYAAAILDAPAMMSSLPDDPYEKLRHIHVESMFGPQLREIEGMEADYNNASAALYIVRKQLQDASGLTSKGFDDMLQPLEAEVDRG